MSSLTFRSSRIVYYGPHACENCGVMICKMGREFGGNAFTYPEGPIYPNTEWHPHVCDPKRSSGNNGLAPAPPGVDLPTVTHLAVTVAGLARRFACGAWNAHQPSTSDRTLVTCPRCLAGQG